VHTNQFYVKSTTQLLWQNRLKKKKKFQFLSEKKSKLDANDFNRDLNECLHYYFVHLPEITSDNKVFDEFINLILQTIDKHAPLKNFSRKQKQKLQKKPCLTKDILNKYSGNPKKTWDILKTLVPISNKSKKNNTFQDFNQGLPSGVGSGRPHLPTFFSKVGCVGSAYFCTSGAYDVSYTQIK